MERCEAPRCIIHPCPAPWLHPAPATVAIRCPIGSDGRRIPDATVLVIVVPTAVFVQVACADHPRTQLTRIARFPTVIATIAGDSPRFKAASRVIAVIGVAIKAHAATVQHHAVATINDNAGAIGQHLSLSAAHVEQRGRILRCGIHHIETGLQERDFAVRRQHAHRVLLLPRPNAHGH